MPVVYNRLPKLAAATPAMVEAAIAKTAFKTEALAKYNAPVDTGNLRNSISASQVRPATWRVTAAADYALYVEVGTHKMGGHFYLTNALTEAWRGIGAVIGDEVGL